ncbi:hypothetical protein [Brevundimonas lenta]|uniref:Translation initiation factor IF-2 n=1 Tax=Brevundimonas lenta TaxID=424796 RepID=A0A7W6JBQ0_9CAUL|nr:hypothetical protein [Brevundimonas lenta]MBB4081267.1 hypothetical protein [Brevundimonas lenta]
MRMLLAAAGAAIVVLAASPVLAGGPNGGSGQPPRPGPCCGHPGGGNTNINVNVNARASAYASASAGSYFNARTYDVGTYRGGYSGGGSVYVGGGYGGDIGGYVGAPVYFNEQALEGAPCPSAPFGYVVTGFGRGEREPSHCGYRYREEHDRGGRYGYSERRESYEESRYEVRESYEEYEAYEGGEYYGRERDCDCRSDREAAPYPPAYLPDPPRYERPAPRRAEPPRRSLPRQTYSQEPGERG